MDYSIGEFSKVTGLGIHTLRYYEHESLITLLRDEGDATLSERMELLIQHRQSLNEQIRQLQEHKAKLDEKIAVYQAEILSCSLTGSA